MKPSVIASRLFLLKVLVFTAVILHATLSCAQPPVTTVITPTTGLRGVGTLVNQVGTTISITGGTRPTRPGGVPGRNLFHGFDLFSVGPGDTANFRNETGLPTTNIIGRITGGQVSNVYGTIQTENFPGANLFLVNPAGWVFGQGATLNVSGSFHASTADYIRFGDTANSSFCVKGCPNGQLSAVSVAEPAAFGFLGPQTASISIAQSVLQVLEGKILSVVGGGGDLRIVDSFLGAPGGRVQIANFASAGEATINGLDGAFASFGPIRISNSLISAAGTASIDANGKLTGSNGGTVLIRGGLIDISGAALDVSAGVTTDPNTFEPIGTSGGAVLIQAGQLVLTGSTITASTIGDGAEVAIGLEATGDIRLAGTGLTVVALGGAAGDVQIKARRLEMQESAFIDSTVVGRGGRGADILVDVRSLDVSGGARLSTQSSGFSLSPAGPAGAITVKASDSIAIIGEASGIVSLSEAAESTGSGGVVIVSAPSVRLETGGTIASIASGIAPGGDLTINAGDLSVINGGLIVSRTFGGAGGDVTVTATRSATVSGAGSSILSGGSVGSSGSAPAGNINVTAGTVTIQDSGVIQNGSTLDIAGNVVVTATDSLIISNGGRIVSQAFAEPVGDLIISARRLTMDSGLIQASTIQAGKAGDITVNVGGLTLVHGAQIVSNSASSATGAGGNLTVVAADSVSISGSNSGLFSAAEGLGPAGQITVTAPGLTMADGATISVATSSTSPIGIGGGAALNTGHLTLSGGSRVDSGTVGAGRGGSITIKATNLALSGSGTGLFSNTGPLEGQPANSGAGGDINVVAGQIELRDGATISANSTGTADALAGSINITFGDSLKLLSSSITTGSFLADGGNITITSTGSLLSLVDSQIITSVRSGLGGGGNITIGTSGHPLDFLVLDNSGIHADAFGGPGGNINILAEALFINVPIETAVTASSALSAPGIISISSTITDVSASLAQLPSGLLEAAALLRASCAARLAEGKASSLVVAGREGVPPEPGGLLPSVLPALGATGTASGSAAVFATEMRALRLRYLARACGE